MEPKSCMVADVNLPDTPEGQESDGCQCPREQGDIKLPWSQTVADSLLEGRIAI